MSVKLLGIKAITSLHVGAGRGQGHVDLPVAREKTTNYPYLPGSSLKGVIRDQNDGNQYFTLAFGEKKNVVGNEKISYVCSYCEKCNEVEVKKITDVKTTAGSLFFTDGRLLALPIRSFFGTFAAVSCPTIIKRLYDDLKTFDANVVAPEIPILQDEQIAVTTNSPLAQFWNSRQKVCLEDVDFNVDTTKTRSIDALGVALARQFPNFGEAGLVRRLAFVSDNAFAFLCETGTEINARIRIDPETGIVQTGALWNQETLPPETFMYSFVFCDKIYSVATTTKEEQNATQVNITPQELLDSLFPTTNQDVYLQFGGKSSTGLGRCQCRFMEILAQTEGRQ